MNEPTLNSVMDKEILASVQAENEALRTKLKERNEDLFEALAALSGMWNQYCSPPWTHEFMNAGEDAEEVLKKWDLLRNDETSIEIAGVQIDDYMPQKVLVLLGISSPPSE